MRKLVSSSIHPGMKDLFGYVYTISILSYIYILILVLSIVGILFLWIPILAIRIKRDWNNARVGVVLA